MLSLKKLFLFDIDGTIALGDSLLPGSAEFFREIKERGGQFVFITNNSTKSIADYIKKFHLCTWYPFPDPRTGGTRNPRYHKS